METLRKQFVASEVSFSETQQSEIYQSIRMRMFDTGANLNGVCVTEAFIDDIIANADKYVCIPLCADVQRLNRGDFTNLGHMYDSRTGEFHSQQIGSFYSFEKETTADGCALIGEARVMKRNEKVCEALAELFDRGELNFSFEVSASDYSKREDGILVIDVSENNYLEGMAVVTNPAYECATALQFVAEVEEGKGSNMESTENIAEVISEDSVESVVEVKAEEEVIEEETSECKEEVKEEETSESEEKEEEEVTCEESVKAEEDTTEEKPEEEVSELAQELSKFTMLSEEINALRQEIEELKKEIAEKKEVVAEVETSSVNPFVCDMTTVSSYSLLESEQKVVRDHFSLL